MEERVYLVSTYFDIKKDEDYSLGLGDALDKIKESVGGGVGRITDLELDDENILEDVGIIASVGYAKVSPKPTDYFYIQFTSEKEQSLQSAEDINALKSVLAKIAEYCKLTNEYVLVKVTFTESEDMHELVARAFYAKK